MHRVCSAAGAAPSSVLKLNGSSIVLNPSAAIRWTWVAKSRLMLSLPWERAMLCFSRCYAV